MARLINHNQTRSTAIAASEPRHIQDWARESVEKLLWARVQLQKALLEYTSALDGVDRVWLQVVASERCIGRDLAKGALRDLEQGRVSFEVEL